MLSCLNCIIHNSKSQCNNDTLQVITKIMYQGEPCLKFVGRNLLLYVPLVSIRFKWNSSNQIYLTFSHHFEEKKQ